MLGGTTRLPALLHKSDNCSVSVEELNIEKYEVIYFETLHCSMNHIKNLLQELPHHITDIDTLIKLKEILAIQYSKDKIRGGGRLPQNPHFCQHCPLPNRFS